MMHGLITKDFADGTYSFRLAYGQWLELQETLNCGPLELYTSMLRHNWRVQYVREIIRISLIGGGMGPPQALRLVKNYVEDRPIIESVQLALEILSASLSLPEGTDAPGEDEAPKTDSTGSTSVPSTATVQ